MVELHEVSKWSGCTPGSLRPPYVPRDLTWDWTRVAAVVFLLVKVEKTKRWDVKKVRCWETALSYERLVGLKPEVRLTDILKRSSYLKENNTVSITKLFGKRSLFIYRTIRNTYCVSYTYAPLCSKGSINLITKFCNYFAHYYWAGCSSGNAPNFILYILGSNLSRDSGYSNWACSMLHSITPSKCHDNT
jgi:hypothetical protein